LKPKHTLLRRAPPILYPPSTPLLISSIDGEVMGYPWPSPLHRVHHQMVEVARMWSDSSSMLVSIEVGVSMNQLIDWFDTNVSFKCLELVSSKSFGTKQPQTYRGASFMLNGWEVWSFVPPLSTLSYCNWCRSTKWHL
jgi:hypothetical protein